MCQAQSDSSSSSCSSSSSSSSNHKNSTPMTTSLDERELDGECLLEGFDGVLMEQIAAMKRQEKTTYKPLPPPKVDDDLWRPQMVQWMFNMMDMFRFVPMVPSTATWFLDKAAYLIQTPEDYQILGLSSLHMAIKVHETKVFPLEHFVQMANGVTSDQVVRMERRLLETLRWNLHPPTPEGFVYTYAELLPEEYRGVVIHMSLRTVRQASLKHHSFYNSVVAYAAMLVALDEVTLPLEEKKSFGLNMMRVAELSADTEGLAEAFQWFSKMLGHTRSPKPSSLRSCDTLHKEEEEEEENQESRQEQQQRPSLPAQPEKGSVSHRQEIVYFAGDGFEISLCESGELDEIARSASMSPRDVAF